MFILLPAPLLEKITHTIKIKNTPENQGERLAAGWFFCYNDDDELRPFFDCVRKTNTKCPLPSLGRQGPHFLFPRFLSQGQALYFGAAAFTPPALLFKEVFP